LKKIETPDRVEPYEQEVGCLPLHGFKVNQVPLKALMN